MVDNKIAKPAEQNLPAGKAGEGTTPNENLVDGAAQTPVDDQTAQADPTKVDDSSDTVDQILPATDEPKESIADEEAAFEGEGAEITIPEPEVPEQSEKSFDSVQDKSELSEKSEQDASAQESESETEVNTDTADADMVEEAADSPSSAEASSFAKQSFSTSKATDDKSEDKETPELLEKSEVSETSEKTETSEPSDSSDQSDNSDHSDTPITPANDNPNAKWYVVHTFSGHENKVATNLKQRIESEHLENRIVDILVPTQDKIEIRGGKKEQVKEKIFPGYILVKMDLDDASWLAVRTTQGVTAFVGMNNKPTPISEREVQSIVKFMTQGAPATFKDVFMVDDTVKIIDGPFTDFIGKVESVDKEKGKVRVLVSIFGRETPVELDFLQVTKL